MVALCTVSLSARGRTVSSLRARLTVAINSGDAVPSPSVERMETMTVAGDGLVARASATRPLALRAKYSYAAEGPATLKPSNPDCARRRNALSLSMMAASVSVAGFSSRRFAFTIAARLSRSVDTAWLSMHPAAASLIR